MKCIAKYTYIKKIKEEITPEWCWFNNHSYKYVLFKGQGSNEEAFINEKRYGIDESLFSGISLCSSLRSPKDKCLEKLIRFLTLDLNFITFSKFITLEKTFAEIYVKWWYITC